LRSRIPIECDAKDMKDIKLKMAELKQIGDDGQSIESSSSKAPPGLISELFTLTGRAKAKGAADYISYLIHADCKFLVFGHHKEVLDVLEKQVISEKVDYIRIDGSTNQDKRETLVKRFQGTETCQVAILSITACGHGLNLTAAGTVVFAELYWVPGQIVQAEDRCHRIGTEYSTVSIHYLIAEDTLDETVWKTLNRKWTSMTSALNGCTEEIDAASLMKGSAASFQASVQSNDTAENNDRNGSSVVQRNHKKNVKTEGRGKREATSIEENDGPMAKRRTIDDYFKKGDSKSIPQVKSDIYNN